LTIGRRKEAVASIRIKPGSGKWTVNGVELSRYVRGRRILIDHIYAPYLVTETMGKFDVFCKARGGGISGEAGAMRLALARALSKFDPAYRQPL